VQPRGGGWGRGDSGDSGDSSALSQRARRLRAFNRGSRSAPGGRFPQRSGPAPGPRPR
ncbi:hypothetical protein P7K49_004348, partial [Saguinus oedipus]